METGSNRKKKYIFIKPLRCGGSLLLEHNLDPPERQTEPVYRPIQSRKGKHSELGEAPCP